MVNQAAILATAEANLSMRKGTRSHLPVTKDLEPSHSAGAFVS